MWFGYADRGIRRWDEASSKMINPVREGRDRQAFDNLIVYNMVEDDSGYYWLATNRLGLVKLDSTGAIRQSVSLKDGLHTTGGPVCMAAAWWPAMDCNRGRYSDARDVPHAALRS
jgi:hypothetical protein